MVHALNLEQKPYRTIEARRTGELAGEGIERGDVLSGYLADLEDRPEDREVE